MKHYIYIDESGPFDERLTGGAASVVGGICSEWSPSEWAEIHRRHLLDWSSSHPKGVCFTYPVHFHCGPLLGRKLAVPPLASDKDIRSFAEGVYHNVLQHSLFGFISKNRGKRFEYSPQATYVMNLVAALRHGFEQLAINDSANAESVIVYVAQRTIAETAKVKTMGKYMTSLFAYITDQLALGEGPGVVLAKTLLRNNSLALRSGIGDRDAGLIAADFICCLSRQRVKPKGPTPLHVCNPDPGILLGDYKTFHDRQANELLNFRYYGSCLEFICRFFPVCKGTPDVSRMLNQLASENDVSVLERELPSLLAVVHMMAKNRNEAPHMLSCARYVADKLSLIASKQIEKKLPGGEKRVWLNFYIQSLSELASCLNHAGEVGPQRDIENRLTAVLSANKADIGKDPYERQSIILGVRNRNLNLLFNDYCFEDAYLLAEELVEVRRAMAGGEDPDELLGVMLGSQGQALAFMGQIDPDWLAPAQTLFKESLKHFASGTRQEEMSKNYLVTSHWQAGQFFEAVGHLPNAHELQSSGNPVSGLTRILLLPNPEKRAFEIVNSLRIMAALINEGYHHDVLFDELWPILKATAERVGASHPYEHWWKWLGILQLLRHRIQQADICFEYAEKICFHQSFTMNTIGNSISLLRIVASCMSGKSNAHSASLQDFNATLSKLRQSSLGFDAYMTARTLSLPLDSYATTARPGTKEFWQLCTLLPFAYS
jgi:hypothetical protein